MHGLGGRVEGRGEELGVDCLGYEVFEVEGGGEREAGEEGGVGEVWLLL